MSPRGRHARRSGRWTIVAGAVLGAVVIGALAIALVDPFGWRATGDAESEAETRQEPAAPGVESARDDESTRAPVPDAADTAWVIAYVTDDGIATMRADGTAQTVPALVGATADWSPDRTRVTMLSYARGDMAYMNDLAVVVYPSGETVLPFRRLQPEIAYFGWLPDSTGVLWGDVEGRVYRVDARTGDETPVSERPEEPALPPLPAPEAEDAIVSAVRSALDPPADAATEVFVIAAWPSPDGALLLVDVEVWRNADQSVAMMERETSIWLANPDGGAARRLADGRSPVWLSE